jgi:uncharacterized oligopeptide transporter (OPT) family protein
LPLHLRRPVPQFKPFVPAESTEREFTLKAVLTGILMAAVFGAANAYLGMKAGMTNRIWRAPPPR